MRRCALERIELIAVGDELLSGRITDTNSTFIGRRLSVLGAAPARRVTVGDDEDAISDALSAAMARAEFVIVMGGLGPTPDDKTIAVVAALLGRKLVLHRPTLRRVQAFFKRRGAVMPKLSARQALVPKGAVLVENPCGMVPGIIIEQPGCTIALLPGVPVEMEALMERGVLPWLEKHYRLEPASRTVRTFGVAESAIAQKAAPLFRRYPGVVPAFYPSTNGVDVVLKAGRELDLRKCVAGLLKLLGTSVYAVGDAPLAAVVGALLRERELMVATAESCTGGLIGDRLTDVAGSSDYYAGGVVSYSNDVKAKLLGVARDTLREHGAVSAATVLEMVTGVMLLLGTGAGIAVSGIAGPGGGTKAKPVGLVYIAVAVGSSVVVERHVFSGSRRMVKERAASSALDLMRRMLVGKV